MSNRRLILFYSLIMILFTSCSEQKFYYLSKIYVEPKVELLDKHVSKKVDIKQEEFNQMNILVSETKSSPINISRIEVEETYLQTNTKISNLNDQISSEKNKSVTYKNVEKKNINDSLSNKNMTLNYSKIFILWQWLVLILLGLISLFFDFFMFCMKRNDNFSLSSIDKKTINDYLKYSGIRLLIALLVFILMCFWISSLNIS